MPIAWFSLPFAGAVAIAGPAFPPAAAPPAAPPAAPVTEVIKVVAPAVVSSWYYLDNEDAQHGASLKIEWSNPFQ